LLAIALKGLIKALQRPLKVLKGARRAPKGCLLKKKCKHTKYTPKNKY